MTAQGLLRYASSAADLAAVRSLRAQAFGTEADADAWDDDARHLMLTGPEGLTGTLRLRMWRGSCLSGYSAQFYDLTRFSAAFPAALEVGRLCLAPGRRDLTALQILLGGLTAVAMAEEARVLFGCSSFSASAGDPPAGALAALRAAPQLSPDQAPGRRAPEILPLEPEATVAAVPSLLPPLLRGYLSLGARVSDHLVRDRALKTLHIFTSLEPRHIPPRRRAALMSLARAAAPLPLT